MQSEVHARGQSEVNPFNSPYEVTALFVGMRSLAIVRSCGDKFLIDAS